MQGSGGCRQEEEEEVGFWFTRRVRERNGVGTFSRVMGWWWCSAAGWCGRRQPARVPRVGVRSGGERSGVCRVQEECSRHGLMVQVPRAAGQRIQGVGERSGYRVGVQGAAASTQGGVMN